MNSRRQTIWLVSMLSLMVVLSAYYLFTDNVSKPTGAIDSALETSEIKVDDLSKSVDGLEANAADNAAVDSAASTPTSTESSNEIISTVQTQEKSSSDLLTSMQLNRIEAMDKETNRLLSIINDSKNDEEVLKANDDLKMLEEKELKITNLEENLQKDFHDAMVKEEGSKWKVVVLAAKLEKSQAVSIIDLVVKEMNVSADKVIVQHLN